MTRQRYFIRNLAAKPLLESFFVSAVVSVIAIRIYLTATDFPQIGGANFHISHMLFGGALMLFALLLQMMFLNNSLQRPIAIIGGLGFGTFIDEIGKFITHDNNYFYQPTFAIIYVIFVILYLYFQYFSRFENVTEEENLVNSLDILEEYVVNDLDPNEKDLALSYLMKANPNNSVTKSIRELVHTLEVKKKHPTLFIRANTSLREAYANIVRMRMFLPAIIVFFITQSSISFLISASLIFSSQGIQIPGFGTVLATKLNVSQTLQLISSIISGFVVLVGVTQINHSRERALRIFKRSILISILVTEVFVFYSNQLVAITLLLFNVLILITLNYMIEQEELVKIKKD